MKKALAAVTLAALGTCAWSQDSLVIYGIVDAGVARMNSGGSIAVFSGAGTRGNASVKTGWPNRIGFRGTEDLGGGLTAWFHLEHRFNVDDGSAQTPFWTGRSAVGLGSKAWGEIAVGRDYLPAFWQALALDPWQWSTVGQMGYIYTWARYTGAETVPRNNNMVSYTTPDFGGVKSTLSYTFSEASATRGSALGGNLIYNKGPVYAALAFDRLRNPGAGDDARLVSIGGAYDFGVVRPRVLYSRSHAFDGTDNTSLMIAATVPVGTGRILVGAAKLRVEGPNNDATKIGVGYHYDLSRRTMLYVDAATAKLQNASRTTGVDAGIRHSF
jgi:predicted porin